MEIHPSLWTILLAKALHKSIDDLKMWDHVVAAGVVFLICLILGLLVKSGVKLIPGKLQQVMELTVSSLVTMLEETIGPGGRKYLPLIGTLAFFIFISNFLGLVPSFSSASGNLNTTMACALIVFFYFNIEGFKEHGIGYLKHFMGPVAFIAPLMFVIEIIGVLARPLSLSVRLFGNISGEHIATGVFYDMFSYLMPIPMMGLGLFAAFLQTFIFIMLTQVYISLAVSHDH